MKKLMVLLMVLAIAMGSVFATESEGQWGGNVVTAETGDSATLNVKLDLTKGMNLFNIGFATKEVTKENINDASIVQKDLVLELNGSEYTGTTYIYYGIKNTIDAAYDISLSIDGALKSDSDATGIDWTIKSEDGSTVSLVSQTTGQTLSDEVWSDVGASQSEFTVVSMPINISTDGFLDDKNLKNEIYSGTVKLTITASV